MDITAEDLRQNEAVSPGDTEIDASMQDALLAYVAENCFDPALCLNSAADYLKTSIYVVSRIFKDATGVGFKEYVTATRLEHARQLLEVSNDPVSQIAADSGFDHTTYFTTLFKNQFGIPPSVYRQKFQNK